MKSRIILAGVLLTAASVYPWSVNTNLVTVVVSVQDANGQAVEDLKASDFRVMEDGRPQPIVMLLFRKPDLEEPAAAQLTMPTTSASWSQPAYLVHRRFLAMFFDFSTMAIPDQVRVRQSAMDFIRKDLKPADLVIVMATTNGKLDVLQDFSDDRSALEEAVRKAQAGDPPESDVLNGMRKLAGIENACRRLSGPALSGNKALLYFADRFPLSGMYIQKAWVNAANTCVRANTPVYPITEATDSLSGFAAITGGGVVPAGGDTTASMELARDRIGSHYVLGYYSTNAKQDGAYRNVNVELARPSALVEYQHGYFADSYYWSFRP